MIKNIMTITPKYIQIGKYVVDYLYDFSKDNSGDKKPLKGMSEYQISVKDMVDNVKQFTPLGIDIINNLLINNRDFFSEIIKEATA